MGFAAPIYLLSLALIPLIVLYHVFRPKSTKVAVSSVVLWQKALTVAGRHSAWDRLIRNLLLILQVLMVIVCALILSGFFVDRLALRPQRYMVVIDTSASMAATDVQPDRFTAAKTAAASYLRSLPENSEVALFEMNSSTTGLLGFTGDLASVERAISELRVKNTTTNADSLISLMTAVAEDRSQGVTVALFTDGNFRLDQKGIELGALEGILVDVFSVGGDAHNVAITGLEIRRPAYGEGLGEVFAVVENFGLKREVFPIAMYQGDRIVKSDYVDLAPSERRVITHQLQSASLLPVRLEIYPDDHLSLDNSAQTLARATGGRDVLLVTRDNKNLYLALSAVPGLRVSVRLPGEAYTASPYGYDLVVYDGVPPGSTLAADTVVINSPLGMSQVRVLEEYEYARMLYIDRSHPVMRYVDERAMIAESGQILDPAPDAAVIAYGTSGPLAVVGKDGRYLYAYFGFPFSSRAFVGSSSFPILISNLVSYMLEGSDDVRQLSPGEPIFVPVESRPASSTEGISFEVILPSGDTRQYEVSGDFFLYLDTYDPGIYQVKTSGRQYGYAVNLFDRDELDISMREGADVLNATYLGQAFGRSEVTSSSSIAVELEVLKRIDYRPVLISLVLLLSVLEWALYHRRWHL